MARALRIYIAGKFDHDYQDLENEYTTLEVEFHNCKYPLDEQEYVKHGLQHDHSFQEAKNDKLLMRLEKIACIPSPIKNKSRC